MKLLTRKGIRQYMKMPYFIFYTFINIIFLYVNNEYLKYMRYVENQNKYIKTRVLSCNIHFSLLKSQINMIFGNVLHCLILLFTNKILI